MLDAAVVSSAGVVVLTEESSVDVALDWSAEVLSVDVAIATLSAGEEGVEVAEDVSAVAAGVGVADFEIALRAHGPKADSLAESDASSSGIDAFLHESDLYWSEGTLNS